MGRKPRKRPEPPAELPQIDPEALVEEEERADHVLQIRLTAGEHEEIRQTAQALGMSMTSYLLGLHRKAVEVLRKKGGR
ncbi:hypothetical protein ACFL09_02580 [Planctomycetota bacterium]